MALSTARIHRVRGRPPLLAAGITSLIHSHSSSVKSLGYVFSFIYPCYTTQEDFSDRLSEGEGHSRPDFPLLHDVQSSYQPKTNVNNIKTLGFYHEIRWSLEFLIHVLDTGVRLPIMRLRITFAGERGL